MSKIYFDDLSKSFQELVDVIGMEAAEKLCRRMGGSEVYIPKLDTYDRLVRNHQIANEFTGSNHFHLAIKYNLSERQIRAILEQYRYSPTHSLSIEDFLPEEE